MVVGTPIANRTAREIEGLIGFFVNTLAAARRPVAATRRFAELLARVRERRWTPTRIRTCRSRSWWRSCSRSATWSHTPLFQVMFALQNAPAAALRAAGTERQPLEQSEARTAKFDLTLSLAEAEWRPGRQLEYSTDLFDRDDDRAHGSGTSGRCWKPSSPIRSGGIASCRC